MKTEPRHSREEFARRGDKIYKRELRPPLSAGNEGKFVPIDIETGAYEIAVNELAASDRLLARVPNAQICSGKLAPTMPTALAFIGNRHVHDVVSAF